MTKEAILKNLDQGLELEDKAKGSCEELMSFFSDKETVNTIRIIRDDELKHIGLVKELIRIINKY